MSCSVLLEKVISGDLVDRNATSLHISGPWFNLPPSCSQSWYKRRTAVACPVSSDYYASTSRPFSAVAPSDTVHYFEQGNFYLFIPFFFSSILPCWQVISSHISRSNRIAGCGVTQRSWGIQIWLAGVFSKKRLPTRAKAKLHSLCWNLSNTLCGMH